MPTAAGADRLAAGERWWEQRWFALALILLASVPLLFPALPPLVDVPGHVGRFHLMLGGSPFLGQYYSVGSLPVGNLGADLFVLPLAGLIGVEPATRIVVLAIAPLTVAAMLWVAREVHGRLPPTAAFAVPLAYSQPLLFGFVNFALAMALALLGFALWLRLGRQDRPLLRAAAMVPISGIIFVAHVFGWGVLGLLCFSAEAGRQHGHGRAWPAALARAALHSAALAWPLLMLLAWRSGMPGMTQDWFALRQKAYFVASILRDRWLLLDLASLFLLAALVIFARDDRRLLLSRCLVAAALGLGVAFLLLPGWLFGSAYADMRLAPFALMMLVLAIGPGVDADASFARRLALAAVAFAIIRLGATTASFALAAGEQRGQLLALDHVPPRSRLVVLVDHRCGQWALPRSDHLGSLVIARRDSFVNDQWALAGGTSVTVHYPAAGRFDSDDSQLVAEAGCDKTPTMSQAISAIPRGAFNAMWLLDAEPRPAPDGWTLRWSGPRSQLYVRAR